MRGSKGITFLLIMTAFGILNAHDLATHIYIGSRTMEAWREFDPIFYGYLTRPDNDILGVLTRKFYYIGLTLPDMFLSRESGDFDMQGTLRTLAFKLDTFRQRLENTVIWRHTNIFKGDSEIVLKVEFSLKNPSPLLLTSTTLSNIATPITFPGPFPNSNLRKLQEMALYARSRTDWSPRTKALIYGAYMHVIQDHFAAMVFHPIREGLMVMNG